jgi:hypothetical protein
LTPGGAGGRLRLRRRQTDAAFPDHTSTSEEPHELDCLGFWLAGLIGLATYGSIARWVVAVVGAALLIWILKALGIFK